ncbi:HesA/MoeB/ThiF family protein [Pseudotamlana carrageenivorans]|uniref:Molybdopterin-synthase adenylyltransferase n=1 Tax=Pseudotamlana carrageenivorans TaxID=2069432 RepID=A0A2I7SDS3_9FLAO|nr:HesA/MoeB/ThiF family protein [Tamlana carrageenivorans]AUS04054.1 dinucleotide-utilizing protein [Tamlana carrageenivorans]
MRYNRHIILSEIGQEGQDKISKAKVLAIGAGGLGCPILQYLAAAGVGTIGIIDFDTVDLSNLQRQILFGNASIGKNKALAAKERLSDLNADITINTYPERLRHQNALELFEQYDIIVDGSDNFETRYLVNDACVITNKPLVFGSIFKFEGQVSVFNYQNGPSYRCLFPNPPEKGAVPNCSEIGVIGVLPGIIGTMQANEVLKIILGIGNVLSGQLLCYNALTLQNTILKINRSESTIESVLKDKTNFQKQHINMGCKVPTENISIYDVSLGDDIQFIDVREDHEQPKIEAVSVTYVPLSELEEDYINIDPSKKAYVFCQAGIRSEHAVERLQELGITNCFSLMEGAAEINDYLNEQLETKSVKS